MGKGQTAGIDGDQYPQDLQGNGQWLWERPADEALATLILAHGAGAPMDSEFMAQMAVLLARRGLAVLRFEFPYMAARRVDGRRRLPNPQAVLLEHWRAVYRQVRQQVAGRLVIGGKSMGGRMASLVADELQADALICLGYPFYAAGKPEKPRVAHLAGLRTPTLIVQGERDPLGNREAVAGYALSKAIQLHWLSTADHDFKPLKRSGLTQADLLQTTAEAILEFLRKE